MRAERRTRVAGIWFRGDTPVEPGDPRAVLGTKPGDRVSIWDLQDDAEADAWVDEQTAVLYGFQAADGTVSGAYLDGNFIRTALLYGFTRTAGLRLDPWSEDVLVGAARDGTCLAVSLSSRVDWSGHLRFDTPRHRLHLNLPLDYARLNKWPEWFVVDDAGQYRVEDSAAQLAGHGLQLFDQMLHVEPLELSVAQMGYLPLGPRQQILVVERLRSLERLGHRPCSSPTSMCPAPQTKPSVASIVSGSPAA